MKIFFLPVFLFPLTVAFSQDEDSLDNARLARMIQLSEVVVRNNIDINSFIVRVKNDTTFYKAFRNLRVIGFTSLNDIRMIDKKNDVVASMQGKTKQQISGGCRSMELLEEKHTGDFFDKEGNYNYYTAELYASLFFTNGKVCGENNIVKGTQRDVRSKKGIEKHKEQLKMLFFDPGKKIPGIPFMGDKTAIFDGSNLDNYSFSLDFDDCHGENCYRFSVKAKESANVVIDNMTTWFNTKTMEIVARNYELSYNTGIYKFNVQMEVQMTKFDDLLVPSILRYIGNWEIVFRKKERGLFTATLFDFSNQ